MPHAQEHDKHEMNTLTRGPSSPLGGPSVPFADHELNHEREVNTPTSFHGSPKHLHSLRQDFGRCEASLGDAIPENLVPQTN
jgi:hypothetical protein